MKSGILFGMLLFIHAIAFSRIESVSVNPVSNPERYNILFIAVDDLRPELNCYGSSQIITPNIDKLADEGMLFTNAYSQQAICTPSRISMLSGLRPSTTGIYDLTDKLKNEAPSVVSMPQTFKNSGYHTLSLGKVYHHVDDDPNAWSEAAWRPGSSDGTWYYQGHLNSSPVDYGLDGVTLYGPPTECIDVADNWYKDGLVAEKAIEKLEEYKDSEFFLAVGFMKPHLPFTAPKKYWDLYDEEDISVSTINLPGGLSEFSTTEWQELRNYFGVPRNGDIVDEQAKKLIHGYWASVSYIDAQIGKVIKKLDELGLRKKTIIVLWSDHGWKLGEYGDWCKHTNFEIDVRTPLIVDVPGLPGGMKCRKMVESVDMFPTLAELLNINPPEGLDGLSFVPLLNNPDNPWKSAAFSQYPRWSNSRMGTTVRTKNYRYTEYVLESSGELISSELYRHENNTPLEIETENLIPLIDSDFEIGRTRDYMKRLLELGWDKVRDGTTIEQIESTLSSVTIGINNVSNALVYKLLMSRNGGEYEEILPGSIDRYTTEITASGLSPDEVYTFQLRMLGDDYKGGVSNELQVILEDYIPLIENGDFNEGMQTGWKYNNNNGSEVSFSFINVDGYENVLKANVSALGTNFWDVGMINQKNNSLDTALVHVSFIARSSVNAAEVTCGFQSRASPSVTRYQTIQVGTDWNRYSFDVAIETNLRDDWQFKCFFVDLAEYYIDSIEASTSIKQVENIETWEIETDERIDTLRRGDFILQMIGLDGQPLSNKIQDIKLIHHDFLFGSMIKLPDENDNEDNWTKATALKYFNLGVISNEFKWSGMQPNEGPPNYFRVDRYLDWADAFNFDMKGHVLLWGGTGDNDAGDFHKLPEWVRVYSDGTPRSNFEIENLIEDRIKNTINYYKDRIHIYDVLNEATINHADWLQNTVGNQINKKVFDWAYNTSPGAAFLINDYAILTSESVGSGSQIYDYVNLINGIQEYAPGSISAIGCQSHLNSSVPDQYYDNITFLNGQTGLPVSITEFDLKVDQYRISPFDMAQQYKKALKLAFSHPAVNSFIFWGFYDVNHWRPGAGMFDENKVPKLAANVVHELINNEWSTMLQKKSDDFGKLAFTGYYGRYEFICEINGELRVARVHLNKKQEDAIAIVDFSQSELMYPEIDSIRQVSGNLIAIYFSKEMDESTLHISEFNMHTQSGSFVTDIQLGDNGKIAYLETSTALDKNGFSQLSYLGKSAASLDGAILKPFGPEEIVRTTGEILLYYKKAPNGSVVISWDDLPNADSMTLYVMDSNGVYQSDTVVVSISNNSVVRTNLISEHEYTYRADFYRGGELFNSFPLTFYYQNNLLENFGFEYEYHHWIKDLNPVVANAEFDITTDASEENLASKISILKSAYPGSVSISTETTYELEAGQTYQLAFDAKALDEQNRVVLSVISPEGEFVVDNSIQLSTEYLNYSYLFKANSPSKYTIKLSVGDYETAYYLDNFSLKSSSDTSTVNLIGKNAVTLPEEMLSIMQGNHKVLVKLNSGEKIRTVKLYNINGQLINYCADINEEHHLLNTDRLVSGLYIILVNERYAEKIIYY